MVFAIDGLALFNAHLIYPNFPVLGMLISSTTYLQFPLLLLFFKASIYRDFKLSRRTLLHLIPFVVINLFFIPYYYVPAIEGSLVDEVFYNSTAVKINYAFLHGVEFIYLAWTLLLLIRYKRVLKENYSHPDLRNYKWLMRLCVLIIAWSFIALIKNILMLYEAGPVYQAFHRALNIIVLAFLYWLLIKALRSPELFTGVNSDLQLINSPFSKALNQESIYISKPNPQVHQVLEFMKNEEPYLDSSLSITKLASQLQIPTKDLSVLINRQLDKHFFDFVNEFRIEKAKNMLVQDQDKDLTVLEILYQVGFNSKSSFNTLFKKYTGMTPTQYRSSHS